MALMERVATLLRANLNELIDRAQDPETLLRQLVVDLENQLMQLKTQVAMALAHQHLLQRKRDAEQDALAEWHRKAALAVSQGEDALARALLQRALAAEASLTALRAQLLEGTADGEALHATYNRLQAKLAETRARSELLVAQHRRARLRQQHGVEAEGKGGASPSSRSRAVRRLESRVGQADAQDRALRTLTEESSLEETLAALEREDRVEQMLADLKKKRLLPTG